MFVEVQALQGLCYQFMLFDNKVCLSVCLSFECPRHVAVNQYLASTPPVVTDNYRYNDRDHNISVILSPLPKVETSEKEDRIDDMKNKEKWPTCPAPAASTTGLCPTIY